MKNITFSALALMALLAFTACRNENTEESVKTAPEAKIEEQDYDLEEMKTSEDTIQMENQTTTDSLNTMNNNEGVEL